MLATCCNPLTDLVHFTHQYLLQLNNKLTCSGLNQSPSMSNAGSSRIMLFLIAAQISRMPGSWHKFQVRYDGPSFVAKVFWKLAPCTDTSGEQIVPNYQAWIQGKWGSQSVGIQNMSRLTVFKWLCTIKVSTKLELDPSKVMLFTLCPRNTIILCCHIVSHCHF